MSESRYRLSDLPALLATPLGRIQFYNGIYYRLWPLLSALARRYRKWVVPHTRVVAVVGSFGKTTTTRTVSAALQRPIHPRLFLNCWSYVSEAVFRIRRGDAHAVVEAGINGTGQMRQYARVLQPDITVVTSIGSEHQRSLGSLDATRDEKADMVRALGESGLAILNGDDPNVMWMADQSSARVVTFGEGEHCDYRAADLRLNWPAGMRFTLHHGGKQHEVSTRLYGPHMQYPLLAAIAVATEDGLTMEQTLAALAELPPTEGRLQTVPLDNGIQLLRDDYKSTLETVHAALDVFGQTETSGDHCRWVVMGEVSEPPGSQGPIYREIGQRIAQVADRALLVGGNFQRYASGARKAGLADEDLVDAGNSVLEAANILKRELQPGDAVLVKGRDTQRLERITLHLQGRTVKCDIPFCDTRVVSCARCPMLERGWEGKRVVI